jgi:hypothetical protein
MTRLQDVRRLEDEFAEAMQRLYTVGNGLARLRAELDREVTESMSPGAAAPTTSARPTPAPLAPPSRAHSPAPAAAPMPAPDIPPEAPATQVAPVRSVQPDAGPRWWQREGAVIKVLVIAGAVVTLAGVAMLLALAMQHGWFGPVPRVVAGGLLAVGLVLAGHLVRSREARAGRSTAGPVAIAATGYAAAYLDIVAMTTIYDFVPVAPGLVLAALVAGSGLLLAWRWASELLAVITVLGAAVLGPAVAGEISWVVSAFLVILAAAAVPAQLSHRWPVLDVARTLPVALALIVGAGVSAPTSLDHRVHIGLAALFAALAAATAAMSAGHAATRDGAPTTGDQVLSTTLAGVAAVPLLAAVGVLAKPERTVCLLLVAAAYLVVAVLSGRGRILRLGTGLRATLASIGTFSLLLAVLSGAPDQHVTTGLILSAAAYLAAAGATHSRLTLWLGTTMAVVAGLSYLPHVASIASAGMASLDGPGVALADSMLAAGLLALAAWTVSAGRQGPAALRQLATPLLWVGALAVTATICVSAGMLVGQSLDQTQAGFVAGHTGATLAWMGAAAGLLGRGLRRATDASQALRVGLVLAAVSVAKLFLFDLAALSGLWRVGAFIGTGVLLLAAGTGYAKALERSRVAVRPAH